MYEFQTQYDKPPLIRCPVIPFRAPPDPIFAPNNKDGGDLVS